ncbi:HD domain-containing protein [Mycena indigotica]|uniref:5'-deoxynucleotidase n=1 Tax=Mycena indigotica TaxID=2126181 RepID=A0A8H6T417_9AGAR|nr:HD domain-containing protein [Mycena indigotica]KAF7309522.1 HD domain-containing protein [Mycena indigotica]
MASREFAPLYASTGDGAKDRLAFFHLLEKLKTQKRTGWVDNNIPNAESISDHMYRMSILAMCMSDQQLDLAKCVMLCLVHDLAEAHVGDIAPREAIPPSEKRRREAETIHNIVHDMLHDSPAAKRIETLWQEYEERKTPEARFVKDLDRFEMAAQAVEYEQAHNVSLQSFFDSSVPHIQHPEVKEWARALEQERTLK